MPPTTDPKGVMLLMPADHYIPKDLAFRTTLKQAIEWAETHDDLVTLGVQPTRAETGYGYLKTGASRGGACLAVDAFVEKPNSARAEEFIRAGTYLWNGGMFVWRAEVILRAFDEHMPEMKRAWDLARGRVDLAYPHLTATSIDYGVMEKAKNVVTFTLDCGWDDLGSWTSLESLGVRLGIERDGNTVADGDVISVDSSGNIVDAPGRLVALLGVTDLVVTEHGTALLIATKDRAQDIKLVVEQVKKRRADLV